MLMLMLMKCSVGVDAVRDSRLAFDQALDLNVQKIFSQTERLPVYSDSV